MIYKLLNSTLQTTVGWLPVYTSVLSQSVLKLGIKEWKFLTSRENQPTDMQACSFFYCFFSSPMACVCWCNTIHPSPSPHLSTRTCQRPRVAVGPERSLPPPLKSNIPPHTSQCFALFFSPSDSDSTPHPSCCISSCFGTVVHYYPSHSQVIRLTPWFRK